MIRGRKKYNIWIAYSDLFTNLSTFLFISAIGMFAALGSGLLEPPGWGGSKGCTVAASASESLTKGNSILEPLGAGAEPCTRYYRMGTFRFRYSADGIGEFKDDPGNALDPAVARDGICAPIWLTITRTDFIEAKGEIVFQGISTADNGWKHQPECKRLLRQEPRINDRDFPQHETAAFVVGECDRDRNAYPNMCRKIGDCKTRPESEWNSLCQEVEAVRKWSAHVPAACLRNVGHQHARQLYSICETAPVDEEFPDHEFQDTAIDPKAKRIHNRPAFWESSVDYSVPRGGTIALAPAPKKPAPRMPPGGSVVVEMRFAR